MVKIYIERRKVMVQGIYVMVKLFCFKSKFCLDTIVQVLSNNVLLMKILEPNFSDITKYSS